MSLTLFRHGARMLARVAARLPARGRPLATLHHHHYEAVFRDADGRVFARRSADNLVVNTGLNDVLSQYYKGSGYTAAHYVGLIDDSPTIAGTDTESSHAGWTEVTDYTTADSPAGEYRAAFTPGAVASQSVDNVGNEAVFTTTGAVAVGGILLSTDQQKGDSPPGGTLVGAAAFTGGDVSVPSGSTITVTLTATAAAA